LVADLVPVALDPALDECIDTGMLTLEGGIVRYRHELARRAVESSISPAQRRKLHRRVVAELQQRPASRASELAHHAERVGDLAALVEYSNQAGNEAAQAGAPREAADHFANMLRHRPQMDRQLLLKALEWHAEQSYLMGNSGAALESMREAAQLRREAPDRVALGHKLTRMARFAWMCGRRADAERFVGEAIPVLESVPPSAELASAYSHRSQLDMLAWHMVSALHWGEKALALAWTRIVPVAVERSTYVLASSLALICLFVFWQPIGGVLWSLDSVACSEVVLATYFFGWAPLLYTTFLIDHFDLFGLKQVWRRLSNKAYRAPALRTPSLYKLVRHPLYIGWLTIFWAAPTMTVAHLVFALGTTAYILVAIRWEERDLVTAFGDVYVDYRARTQMLVPRFRTQRTARSKTVDHAIGRRLG
jgi:protein-S-isoprenylcysteine O-methyltransferase Ste14